MDSNFTLVNFAYAEDLFRNSTGKLEAKTTIGRAMRERKKLPFKFEILILIYHHLINNDWAKAEELIKMQLEIAPHDALWNHFLTEAYWNQGKKTKLLD